MCPRAFVLSKAWYVAHLLPLATSASNPALVAPATRFWRLLANFLWADRLQRAWLLMNAAPRGRPLLPRDHGPGNAGQAGLSSPGCCPALHLAYWLGISLKALLPAMASAGATMVGNPAGHYADLLTLRKEIFSTDCIDTGCLQLAKSAAIYKELTATLPPP